MPLLRASTGFLLGVLFLIAGCETRTASAPVEPIPPAPKPTVPTVQAPVTAVTEMPRTTSTTTRVDVPPAGPQPASTTTPAPPPGATALCDDGTYSFSRRRPNACLHHGGVARWL